MPGSPPRVSVIVLTYNAPAHCRKVLRTLRRTRGVPFEVVVVDNRSRWPTRLILLWNLLRGRINRLCLLDRNTLFAAGNNTGAGAASRESTHVLLLNSDVKIIDPGWLSKLLSVHRRGATSYGAPSNGVLRVASGYCLLVDADLYRHYLLDERLPWFYCVSELQARLLNDGYSVRAIADHRKIIKHAGGASGKPGAIPAGRDASPDAIREWFAGREVEILPDLAAATG